MLRVGYIGGVLGLVLLLALVALSFLDNPISARDAVLAERLSSLETAHATYERPSRIDYASLENAILAKPSLWQPLIRKPQQQAPPPDVDKLLNNVAITRHRMGSGDDIQVKVLVLDQGGQATYWLRKGDLVNGLTVKEIARDQVVFSLIHDGTEYIAYRRP